MSGAAFCMPWHGLLDDTLHFGLLSSSWPWSASCCTHKLTRAFFPSQLPAGNHGGACATFVEKALVSLEAGSEEILYFFNAYTLKVFRYCI